MTSTSEPSPPTTTTTPPTMNELQMPVDLFTPSVKLELSAKDWAAIDKEGLEGKPVIVHPELGEVVEIRPGVLARRVTAEQQYERHLVSFQGPRMPSDALERRRFAMMMSAKRDEDTELFDSLSQVATLDQLDEVMREHMKTVKTMDDIAADPAYASLLEHNEEEAKKVYDALVKDGRVLKLQPGEVVNKKCLTKEAVERLRKDGYNVFVTRPPSEDKYMNKIRRDAETAMAFVEGKLQLDSLKDGVNGSTPDAVKQELQVAVAAATNALSLFEQEKNVITRHDGEELAVRVNITDYYKGLKALHIDYKDIREFQHEHGRKMASTFATVSGRCNEMLIFVETLDCAVFVPRLCLLLCEQPLPRVVEFSRVYTVYFAAFNTFQSIKLMPTRASVERHLKKAKRELATLADQNSGDVKFASERAENSAPSWTKPRTALEDVSEGFSQMRLLARTKLLNNVCCLHAWFNFESKCHAEAAVSATGASSTYTQRSVTDPELIFTHDEVKSNPFILERYFFRQLWLMAQHFAGEVLRAYEFALLLQLEEYLPRQTAEHWRSVALLPENLQCPGITKKLILENNEKLTAWRTFDSEVLQPAMDRFMLAAPKLSAEFDDKRVDADQDWSPTFKQMHKYHQDMTSLFRLDSKEIKKIVREYRASERQRSDDAHKASLNEYLKIREEAEKKKTEKK